MPWIDGDKLTPQNLNSKGPGNQFFVTDPTYGATGDGATDDTTALQSAINAANANSSDNSGSVVYLPQGTYVITSTLTIPHRVRLVGANRESTTIKASSATFPADTPVVTLGEAGVAAFGTRLEDLRVDCSNITGSVGVYSDKINELSGLERVLVKDALHKGIHISGVSSLGIAQNYHLRDIEVIMSSNVTDTAIGIDIDGYAADTRGLDGATVTVTSQSATSMDGIHIDAAPGVYSRIHVENATNGIVIGSEQNTANITLMGVTGHSNMSNVVVLSDNSTTQNINILGVSKKGADNILVDRLSVRTLTNTDLGFYYLGGGTAPNQILYSSIGGSTSRNRLPETAMQGAKFIQQTAGFTDGDLTPSVTGGNVFACQNTSRTTITQFDNGSLGQHIDVILDGNTVIEHDGSDISTMNGSDISGFAGMVASFTVYGSTWYETSRNSFGSVFTSVPATGTASGAAGDMAYEASSGASYLYVCTSANSWHRAALNPF